MRLDHHTPRASGRVAAARRSRGFTLVELMVALTISLIILLAVASLFASSRATYQTDEGLARLQENARFALEALNREVRMAGYMGCLRTDSPEDLLKIHNNLNSTTNFIYDFRTGIQGFEASGTGSGGTQTISVANPDPSGVATSNWGPTLDVALQNRVLPGTDVIVIRRAGDAGTRLVSPYTNAGQVFYEGGTGANFQAGDILMVTDCSQASVFQVTTISASGSDKNASHSASGAPGNACPNWGQPTCPDPAPQNYTQGSFVSRAVNTSFYVGRGASGTPALFMTQLNGGALSHLELVEGVESMQVLYGVDTTAPPAPLDFADRYMTASEVNALTAANPQTGWPRVMSVRISLLLRTSNISGQADQSVDTNTYNVAGTTVDPADDRRKRRVFTTTIQLRNRLTG